MQCSYICAMFVYLCNVRIFAQCSYLFIYVVLKVSNMVQWDILLVQQIFFLGLKVNVISRQILLNIIYLVVVEHIFMFY